MNIKRLTCASAIAIAPGTTSQAAGSGVAAAQPGPPCGFRQLPGNGRPGYAGPMGQPSPDSTPDLPWRGIDQGRFHHQPFNYNGRWVSPFFNPQFNNWGFWLFGIWIPL